MRLALLLLVAFATPAAAQRMTQQEAAQLYAAGGFPIAATGKNPVNRCGQPASPRITFVDVNEDKRPEALFIDQSACYKRDGRWFALATKGTDGRWRRVIEGEGEIRATGTKANGWFVFETTGGGVSQRMRYDGAVYVPALPPSAPPSAPPSGPSAPAAGGVPSSPVSVAKLIAWDGESTAAARALTPAARAEIFRAAGVKRTASGKWTSCVEDPSGQSEARIVLIQDVNGDGGEEALIYDSGSYCNGFVGMGSILLSKSAGGGWRVLHQGQGIADFVKSRGSANYPDLYVGMPGACFPYRRWNGRDYDLVATLDERGRPCRP